MSLNLNVFFTYNGMKIEIQWKKADKIKNIINRFCSKVNLDKTKLYYYLYNGNKINEELKFEETINKNDKIIKILVIEENKIIKNENIKEINEIICPECGENILIKIEYYRMNMYKCKNNHNRDNISIDELNNITKIDISKIICNECKENNKGNTYKNKFYQCLTCSNKYKEPQIYGI